MADFSAEKLRYYLEAEKPCFTDRVDKVSMFEPHWDKLTEYLEHQTVS